MLLFMARNSFILSVIAVDVVSFSYFFAENVFYSFILALVPSYSAYGFFKLIASTTFNVDYATLGILNHVTYIKCTHCKGIITIFS